jgi:hypothetical protein
MTTQVVNFNMNIGTSESKPEVDPVKPGLYRISKGQNNEDGPY